MENENLAALVLKAQQGDTDAMDALFTAYYNDVYYFALKTVKDPDIACDITQETFLEIIRSIGNLKEPLAFVAWMKQVAYSKCTRYFNKRKDVQVEEDEDGNTIFDTLADEGAMPAEILEQEEFRQTILAMIDELTEEQRSAVLLYYFDELTVGQIAQIQSVSEGTVKSRLNYARKAIKKSIEGYEKKHNIKLHSVALLPLLMLYFCKEAMPAGKAKKVRAAVLGATGKAVGVAATVTKGALIMKLALLPIWAKITAAVVALTLVVGGTVLIFGGTSSNDDTATPTNPTQPTEHTHQWTADVKAPSCTEAGHTTYTCTCGDSYIGDKTDPAGHSWAKATCTDPKTCKACGVTDGRAAGHQWNEGEVVKEATEEQDGEAKYTCTVCGENELRIIPSKNHVHNHTKVVVTPPTCTEKGFTTHTCLCGDSYTDTEVAETGHTYQSIVTAPTETEQGYTTHNCTACGHSYQDAYTDPVVSYKPGTLVLGANKIATLYGEDNQVVNTYTGWDTNTSSNRWPWRADKEKLIHVIVQDGVSIQTTNSCFSDCTNLQSVTLSGSITKIGVVAFSGCTSLQSITIPDGVTSIDMQAFEGCTSLQSITIPDSVTSVGKNAFRGCTGLQKVDIGDGVTDLKGFPLGGVDENTSLTTVILGKSITSIPHAAFRNCTSLQSINIPDSVTTIDTWAFWGCTSLTSINIPGSVTSIGHSAFSDCTSLTGVNLSEGVTSIDRQAFMNCTSLTSITIPDSVTSIGNFAFSDCTSLTSITIPDSVTSIGEGAFYGCSLQIIDIGDGVTDLNAFSLGGHSPNTSLTTVILGKSITSIPDHAFWNCTSLTSIKLSENVTSIGLYAFSDCTSLTSINIPEGITVINGAFMGCTSLQSVTLPNSVTSIQQGFRNCTSLTDINIPEGVTILDDAFDGCTSLTSITIPNSVTSIDFAAFRGCTSLTSITIPDSVTSIDEDAFRRCSSLTSITFNGSCPNIDATAFDQCSRLETVYIKDAAQKDAFAKAFPNCQVIVQ